MPSPVLNVTKSCTRDEEAEERIPPQSLTCVRRQALPHPWSHVPITFSEVDLRLQHYPHNDPLVIRANIGKNSVHFAENDVGRILVDNGSSVDIITWQCFVKIGLTEQNLHES